MKYVKLFENFILENQKNKFQHPNHLKETHDNIDSVELNDISKDDAIYNENGLVIYEGDSKEKCILYGKGENWCISRKDLTNTFNSYRYMMNEPNFYFIFDADKKESNPFKKIVLLITKDGKYIIANRDNSGNYDGNNLITWSNILRYQPKLKNIKHLFKSKPLTDEEKRIYNIVKKRLDVPDLQKHFKSYDMVQHYISYGHKLSVKQARNLDDDLLNMSAQMDDPKSKFILDFERKGKRKFVGNLRLKDIFYNLYSNGVDIEILPDDFEVVGNLILDETKITYLPKGLKVRGYLDLRKTNIEFLPDDLEVDGYISLSDSKIKSLPKGLKVNGDLFLSGSDIETLPDDLEVNGRLFLDNTKIKHLPKGLKVKSHLYLNRTDIEFLPDDLEFGGDLFLNDTKIKSLPKGLKVKGSLFLSGSDIETLSDDLEVNDNIDLEYTKIKSLPKGLKVNHNLYLTGSDIEFLPDNFEVGGWLDLEDTKIKSLPKGLKVKGNLCLTGTDIESLPDDLEVGGKIFR